MSQLGKRSGIMAGMLAAAVFFEGAGFSFHFLTMRVRSVQVLEVVFFGFLFVLWLLGKWRWQRSPLDFWLLAYLAVNFIAIFNSPWSARSVKIFLLLVSLALLYWLLYQLLRDAKDFFLAFYVFLTMGVLQVLFGLYQVLAGALNHFRGWQLPIGHLGVVHREFINSPWGRPYGTQVEPDFYGAICMVFALIFLNLAFSSGRKSKKWFLAGAVVSLVGLYLSFVRTAWLAFLLLFLLQFLLRKKWPFLKFGWKRFTMVILLIFGLHLVALHSIAPIRAIYEFRFAARVAPVEIKDDSPPKASVAPVEIRDDPLPKASVVPAKIKDDPSPKANAVLADNQSALIENSLLNSENIRFFLIRTSWRAFLENPLFGNGPGSFAYFHWKYRWGEEATQKKIKQKAFPQTDPSILFTVLGDTGVVGFALFAIIVFIIISLHFRKIDPMGRPPSAQALALFVGLSALFLSYLLTSGFWLPLTWVFLGLSMASLKKIPAVGDESPTGNPGG